MPENIYPDGADEINLFELLEVLKSEWKAWVGTTVLGAALATSVAFILPPKYEASTVVRVGQVGQATGGSIPIESLLDVVVRIQTPAFRRAVAEQLLGKEASAEAVAQEMDRLKATPPKVVKGTGLVEITATAKTPEAALKMAQAIVEGLKIRHQPIFDQAVEKLKSRLSETTQSLSVIDKGYAVGATANPVQGGAFVQLAQLTETSRYAALRNQQLAIENALLPLNTRPTEALEAISVTDRPVSPKKALIATIGVLGGGMLGLLLVVVRRAWRNFKDKAA